MIVDTARPEAATNGTHRLARAGLPSRLGDVNAEEKRKACAAIEREGTLICVSLAFRYGTA